MTGLRGSEWTPLYMMIVIAIAAIVIVSLVKPAFVLASQDAAARAQEAQYAAKAGLFFLALRR